jgi:hypothetical protein
MRGRKSAATMSKHTARQVAIPAGKSRNEATTEEFLNRRTGTTILLEKDRADPVKRICPIELCSSTACWFGYRDLYPTLHTGTLALT